MGRLDCFNPKLTTTLNNEPHRPQGMHGDANLATTEALEAEQGQRTFTCSEQKVNPLVKWSHFVTH